MTKKVLLLLTLATLFLQNCDTTEPKEDNIKPGSRDYTWEIDTLDAPGTFYFRMWGSSPEDLWLVSDSYFDKSIAHFDGNKWSYYGVKGMHSAYSIWGLSENNIFIGSDGGEIWQFNGSNWQKIATLTKDGSKEIAFDNIWCSSPNNIYACGAYPDDYGYYTNSVIAHYNGIDWEIYNTDKLYGIVEHLYQNTYDKKIYLQVLCGRIDRDSSKIYEYLNGNYNLLYGNKWTQGLQADISLINNEVFFVFGNEILTRRKNKFHKVLNVNNPNFHQRIWGKSSKDIFLLMTDGLVHYNGTDTEYLFKFSETRATQIFGSALFKNEVFFLVVEGPTNLNLIYHGTLKE